MAIFLALRSPEVQVIGLTTIYGNVYTTLATRNALHLVKLLTGIVSQFMSLSMLFSIQGFHLCSVDWTDEWSRLDFGLLIAKLPTWLDLHRVAYVVGGCRENRYTSGWRISCDINCKNYHLSLSLSLRLINLNDQIKNFNTLLDLDKIR